MKKLFFIACLVALTASCKSTKYAEYDCYKTKYKPVKGGKMHVKCDAYN